MAELELRYEANKKSAVVAYLLWFFLGGLGAHRFYLGDKRYGGVMLGLTLLGILTLFIFVGALLILAVAVWCLVDAFKIPDMVSAHNNDLIDRLEYSGRATDSRPGQTGPPPESGFGFSRD